MKRKLTKEQSVIKDIKEYCKDALKEEYGGMYTDLAGNDVKQKWDGYYSGKHSTAEDILGILENLTEQ
jgi:hypothetical protein